MTDIPAGSPLGELIQRFAPGVSQEAFTLLLQPGAKYQQIGAIGGSSVSLPVTSFVQGTDGTVTIQAPANWTITKLSESGVTSTLTGRTLVFNTDTPISGTVKLRAQSPDNSQAVENTITVTVTASGTIIPANFTVSIARTADGSVGQTYTATPTGTGPYSYQWYQLGGSDISGANSASYVAQSTDVGKILGCRVTKGGMEPVNSSVIGWVLAAPILLWSFDDLTGVTNNLPIAPVVDTTNKVQGAASLMTTGNGTSQGGYLQKTNLITSDPVDLDVVSAAIILPDATEYQNVTSFDIRLGRGGTYYTQSGVTSITINENLYGTVWNSFPISKVNTLNTLGAGQIDARVLPGQSGTTSGSPYAAKPRVDALVAKSGNIPTLIMTMDDGHKSLHSWWYQRCLERNLSWTFFNTAGEIGGTDIVTLPNLQEWKASNLVDIAINNYYANNNGQLSDFTDTDAWIADMRNSQNYLLANGLDSEARHHFCYANGQIRVAGTKIRDQSVACNGTNQVTLSAANASIVNGMVAAGYQVPVGTTVTAVSGTTVTLSNVVPTQTVPLSFTNTSGPFHVRKPQVAAAAAGFRSGRTTNGGLVNSRFGIDAGRALTLPAYSMSLQTTATMNGWVDDAKTSKAVAVCYGHIFDDTSSSGLRTATAEALGFLDYVASERQAGRLQVLTISQWWKRDGTNTLPL